MLQQNIQGPRPRTRAMDDVTRIRTELQPGVVGLALRMFFSWIENANRACSCGTYVGLEDMLGMGCEAYESQSCLITARDHIFEFWGGRVVIFRWAAAVKTPWNGDSTSGGRRATSSSRTASAKVSMPNSPSIVLRRLNTI